MHYVFNNKHNIYLLFYLINREYLLSLDVLALSAVRCLLGSLLGDLATRCSLANSKTSDSLAVGFLSVLSVGFTGGFRSHYIITNEKKIPKFNNI